MFKIILFSLLILFLFPSCIGKLATQSIHPSSSNSTSILINSFTLSKSSENCSIYNLQVDSSSATSKPLSYKWFRNGVEIIGAPNSQTLQLTIDDPNLKSNYTVLVSDGTNTKLSDIHTFDKDFITANVIGSGNGYHNCEIYIDGKLRCHGFNIFDQVGITNLANVDLPTLVLGLKAGTIETISIGTQNTCVIISGGVQCWGRNNNGQLGNNTLINSTSPVDVQNMQTGVSFIAGGGSWGGGTVSTNSDAGFNCAVKSGAVYCWGFGYPDIMGTSLNQKIPIAIPVLTSNVEALALGYSHACAVMNGAAYCWGSNSVNSGLLGDGNTNSTSTPVAVVGLPGTVTAVGAGATFSCALSSDSVYCWGSNSNSQLGQLATVLDKSYSPILVPGLTNVAMMSVNDYGGCVAKKNFEFWCWGQGAGASGAPKLMKTFSKMPSSIGHTGMGGAGNSYAVVDGLIYAFGNYTSQIGNPNAHSSIYNLTCLEEI